MKIQNRDSHNQSNTIFDIVLHFGIVFTFSIISSGVIYIWTESLIGFLFVGITSLFWGISSIFMSRFNPETAKYFIYNNKWIHQGYFYILDGIILILLSVILLVLQ
ncbi:hypothetical protein [Candidatus Hodarchaeum mangrovi]